VLSCDLSLITMHISDCCQFSAIHISQGSVATYLRCGGIFKYQFVANLPLSLPVKEFWKSVNIWGSYGQEFSVLFFFETQCISVSPSLPCIIRILIPVLFCACSVRPSMISRLLLTVIFHKMPDFCTFTVFNCALISINSFKKHLKTFFQCSFFP